MYKHSRFAVFMAFLAVLLGLALIIPQAAWADTLLQVTFMDPDAKTIKLSPETGLPLSGTVATVTAGTNQKLGTIRLSGENSILANPVPGRRVTAVLPLGTAYMQLPIAETAADYFSCPETVGGKKNALRPGSVQFASSTPRSITLVIQEVDPAGQVAAIDFNYDRADRSSLRIAQLADQVSYFHAIPNQPMTRLEFCRFLYAITMPFNSQLTEYAPLKRLSDRFTDVQALSAEDQARLKILVDNGILTGDPSRKLRPNAPITRAEAFVLLGKAVLPTERELTAHGTLPAWARPYIENLLRWGVVKWGTDGSAVLNRPLTRAEALNALQKALETYSLQP